MVALPKRFYKSNINLVKNQKRSSFLTLQKNLRVFVWESELFFEQNYAKRFNETEKAENS